MASRIAGITGGEDLARALADFPLYVELKVTSDALREGGKVIAEAARANVPVESGALRDSIQVRRRVKKKTGFVNYLVTAGDRRRGVWYAHLVEYGFGSFYEGTGTKSKRAPYKIKATKGKALLMPGGQMLMEVTHKGGRAKGFLRRAFDSKSEAALMEIVSRTRKGVDRFTAKRSKGLI